jgi:hypothetical protein
MSLPDSIEREWALTKPSAMIAASAGECVPGGQPCEAARSHGALLPQTTRAGLGPLQVRIPVDRLSGVAGVLQGDEEFPVQPTDAGQARRRGVGQVPYSMGTRCRRW